jgi:hypothetical protein
LRPRSPRWCSRRACRPGLRVWGRLQLPSRTAWEYYLCRGDCRSGRESLRLHLSWWRRGQLWGRHRRPMGFDCPRPHFLVLVKRGVCRARLVRLLPEPAFVSEHLSSLGRPASALAGRLASGDGVDHKRYSPRPHALQKSTTPAPTSGIGTMLGGRFANRRTCLFGVPWRKYSQWVTGRNLGF